MTSYIIDKLYKRVEERGVVCVGLDTALDYVPDHIMDGRTPGEAIFEFNKQLLFLQLYHITYQLCNLSF